MLPPCLRTLLFVSVFLVGSANGFAPTTTTQQRGSSGIAFPSTKSISSKASFKPTSTKTTTRLHVLVELESAIAEEMMGARFAFGMCFFGALGVGGVGRELIPLLFGRYQKNKSLVSDDANNKDNADDDEMGIWGYPEKIYGKDVKAILNNKMSAEAMARKYNSNEESYYSEKQGGRFKDRPPFLRYEDYCEANPKANRLAVRVVFDSFSNSIGGCASVAPVTAQDRIDLYRTDVSAVARQVNGGKTLGITAFVTLLVLLGFLDYLAVYHIWKGWFPLWEGFNNMPQSLLDGSTGVRVLPDYFVNGFNVKTD